MLNSSLNPLICVIIVTYNGEKWIRDCISSILLSEGVDLKIIVVDNRSIDNTRVIVQKFCNENDDIILLSQNLNLGFGKANNIGIKYAIENVHSDYLFLLNQDTTLEDKYLIFSLIEAINANPSYGIISPIHLNDFGSDLDYLFKDYVREIPLSIKDIYYTKDTSYTIISKPKEVLEVPFINAAAWLLKASTLIKVGLFNPIFPHYGEDNDFINRLIKAGFKVGITTSGSIRHFRYERSLSHNTKSFNKEVQRQYIVALIMINNVSNSFSRSLKIFFRYQFAVSIDYIKSSDWKKFKISFLVMIKVIANFYTIFKNRSHNLMKN